MSAAELHEIVDEVVDIPSVLTDADPEPRARVYADLGITHTYRPTENLVAVAPLHHVYAFVCRRGDLNPHAPKGTSPSS